MRAPPSSPSAAATSCSAASIATRRGDELPGIGLLPLHTVAGRAADDRRRAARLRLGRPDARRLREPRRAHDPRRRRGAARPRRLRASATTARPGSRAAARQRVYGTYLHGPLLPRNPWFADRLLAEALAHAGGPTELAPLPDELEAEAHASPPNAHEPAAAGSDRTEPAFPGSAGPERAEVHGRVARLPALEEALDRRVHDDVLQLVVGEEACALHGRILASRRPRASGARDRRRR